jgi:hypothetical protein
VVSSRKATPRSVRHRDKTRCVESPILSSPFTGKDLAPAFARTRRVANRLLWLRRACPSATLDKILTHLKMIIRQVQSMGNGAMAKLATARVPQTGYSVAGKAVGSRSGAVGWVGLACWQALSVACAQGVPLLPFPPTLIKPDMPSCRIRLSDHRSMLALASRPDAVAAGAAAAPVPYGCNGRCSVTIPTPYVILCASAAGASLGATVA